MNRSSGPRGRQAIKGIGVVAARAVRKALGYVEPTELDIETLAYLRGALVRAAPTTGARANLIRVGDRGIIGVAEGLSPEERRWAVAHELGHFEAHAGVSFLGLCSSSDMVSAYEASGREPEANAFAAELLMPGDLFAPRGDVARVSWTPMHDLAKHFHVSATAAALRFIDFTDERVALVCAKDGIVSWTVASKTFGERPARGSKVAEWTEAHSFFENGTSSGRPETVSGSAWLAGAEDDDDLVEHVLPMPAIGVAMSLLWWKP